MYFHQSVKIGGFLFLYINDVDGNGQYDVKDFLKLMEKKEVEKKTGVKKVNICLMNPPYGTDGSQDLHYKFVEKCLDISDINIVVMPFGLINKSSSKATKYKDKFDKYLTSVEEVSSKLFIGTAMNNVGIYIFDNKKENNTINVQYLNGNLKNIKSLHNISRFYNDIEENIYNYFKSDSPQTNYPILGAKLVKTENDYKIINKRLIAFEDFFKKNKNGAILFVNDANGGMNGTYMSSRVGQIITSYNELKNFIKTFKPLYNVLCFSSEKAAENCKIALKNPVLRFLLYRIQDDQHMHIKKCYSHIPSINWSDDKVKTDEGLLEVCGCPKDKCKEYADYCKKIIDEVDKGNRP